MLQIICSIIAAFTSFVVSYLTVKNQRKKDAADRRFEVYKSLLEFLFNLRDNPRSLADYRSLRLLRDQEASIGICGSRNLIGLLRALISDYEKCLDSFDDANDYWSNRRQGEALLAWENDSETTSSVQTIHEDNEFEEKALGNLITQLNLNAHIEKISGEMRRSLGYREFRPAVWFRQTRAYSHLTFWSY